MTGIDMNTVSVAALSFAVAVAVAVAFTLANIGRRINALELRFSEATRAQSTASHADGKLEPPGSATHSAADRMAAMVHELTSRSMDGHRWKMSANQLVDTEAGNAVGTIDYPEIGKRLVKLLNEDDLRAASNQSRSG